MAFAPIALQVNRVTASPVLKSASPDFEVGLDMILDQLETRRAAERQR